MAKQRIFDLPVTKGSFQVAGIVSGTQKDNFFTEKKAKNALTCHKCQGSGYKTVIAIIDTSHYIMLDSCLLYTAITRAKKRCLLLADPKAFIRCINTNKSTARQTWLSEMPH